MSSVVVLHPENGTTEQRNCTEFHNYCLGEHQDEDADRCISMCRLFPRLSRLHLVVYRNTQPFGHVSLMHGRHSACMCVADSARALPNSDGLVGRTRGSGVSKAKLGLDAARHEETGPTIPLPTSQHMAESK
nr:hypothetical protein CFP56_00335 [Quercus suber]